MPVGTPVSETRGACPPGLQHKGFCGHRACIIRSGDARRLGGQRKSRVNSIKAARGDEIVVQGEKGKGREKVRPLMRQERK